MNPGIRIGLIGDRNENQKAHEAIPKVLQAASDGVESVWIGTGSVSDQSLAGFDGYWCVPGMPYRDSAGAMRAIRHARMTRTPFLGTSAGFQYAILEFARNVLGLAEAEHQKINPKASMPLISPLGCALAGVQARVHFTEGSHLRRAYRAAESVEEYRCSFGVNGRYQRLIEGRGLYVAAVDDQQEIRAVELDGHPFFVATLFLPEMRSGKNPIVESFVDSCRRLKRQATPAAENHAKHRSPDMPTIGDSG